MDIGEILLVKVWRADRMKKKSFMTSCRVAEVVEKGIHHILILISQTVMDEDSRRLEEEMHGHHAVYYKLTKRNLSLHTTHRLGSRPRLLIFLKTRPTLA